MLTIRGLHSLTRIQKRKAQNRAAQRAFRERKEKHLKDLETRVAELAKAREADQHENGLLKAQVDRLQGELKDYRKRLSLNGPAGRASPPSANYNNQSRSNSSTSGQANFQFDFPKFGGLPGSQFLPNASQSGSLNNSERGSVTPPIKTQSPGANLAYGASAQQPVLNRANSGGNGLSPGSLQSAGSNTGSPANSSNLSNNATFNFTPYSTNDNMHGFATTLPQMSAGGNDPFGDLFSPSILKTIGQSGNGYFNPTQQNVTAPIANVNNGGDSTAGIPDNRVFRFNSTSNTSDSASPSASSLSQWNANGTANSSCGTSPEPSHGSPLNKDKPNDTYEKSSLQNTYNINSAANTSNAFMSNQYSNNNNNNFGTLDMGISNATYNMPQLDSFDPVLFGDYRDTSQDNMFGGADFNNDFFNDALNQTGPVDYSSPSNLFGILQPLAQTNQQISTGPAPSRNLMAEMDKTRDGGDDDYGLPATLRQNASSQQTTVTKKDSTGKLISCNNIWYVLRDPPSPSHLATKLTRTPRTQLQSNPDFQDGKFDLDGLCAELRAKARCSESGVMVDQDHVDKALKKLSKSREEVEREGLGPPEPEGKGQLLFEQDSWDNVLKKMGGDART
jgi:AP-1-like factor